MFVSRKIWRALFSCNTRSEIRLFALLPTLYAKVHHLKKTLKDLYLRNNKSSFNATGCFYLYCSNI